MPLNTYTPRVLCSLGKENKLIAVFLRLLNSRIFAQMVHGQVTNMLLGRTDFSSPSNHALGCLKCHNQKNGCMILVWLILRLRSLWKPQDPKLIWHYFPPFNGSSGSHAWFPTDHPSIHLSVPVSWVQYLKNSLTEILNLAQISIWAEKMNRFWWSQRSLWPIKLIQEFCAAKFRAFLQQHSRLWWAIIFLIIWSSVKWKKIWVYATIILSLQKVFPFVLTVALMSVVLWYNLILAVITHIKKKKTTLKRSVSF